MENIKELSIQEVKSIEGGVAPLLIAGAYVVGAYAAGLGIGALSAHMVYKLTH